MSAENRGFLQGCGGCLGIIAFVLAFVWLQTNVSWFNGAVFAIILTVGVAEAYEEEKKKAKRRADAVGEVISALDSLRTAVGASAELGLAPVARAKIAVNEAIRHAQAAGVQVADLSDDAVGTLEEHQMTMGALLTAWTEKADASSKKQLWIGFLGTVGTVIGLFLVFWKPGGH